MIARPVREPHRPVFGPLTPSARHPTTQPGERMQPERESDEGPLLELEFADKQDWRTLDAAFLDQAPRGYASALSFFSEPALRA